MPIYMLYLGMGTNISMEELAKVRKNSPKEEALQP